MSAVVPIADYGHRMPEAGRIRLGEKKQGSRFPTKLKTLRFTSSSEDLIKEIASEYGGNVKPWSPSKGREEFEVITAVSEVPVLLGPDPLSGPIYELWSAGGIIRRCTGTEATVSRATPEGAEPGQVPCICHERQVLECSVKTRLSVVLHKISFAGTWRLETGSKYAARELPGMVATIQALQASGFPLAVLYIRPETQVKDGQTHHFQVPTLRTEHTPEEITTGASSLGALAAAHSSVPLSLPAPPTHDDNPLDLDDEIVEAEIVEEGGPAQPGDSMPPSSTSGPTFRPEQIIAIRCRELGLDDAARHGFAFVVSEGRTSSTKELQPDERERVLAVLGRIERGEVEFTGVVEGRSTVKRKEP